MWFLHLRPSSSAHTKGFFTHAVGHSTTVAVDKTVIKSIRNQHSNIKNVSHLNTWHSYRISRKQIQSLFGTDVFPVYYIHRIIVTTLHYDYLYKPSHIPSSLQKLVNKLISNFIQWFNNYSAQWRCKAINTYTPAIITEFSVFIQRKGLRIRCLQTRGIWPQDQIYRLSGAS